MKKKMIFNDRLKLETSVHMLYFHKIIKMKIMYCYETMKPEVYKWTS